jgi:hypothetical protein
VVVAQLSSALSQSGILLPPHQNQNAGGDREYGQYKTHIDKSYAYERQQARGDEPNAEQEHAQIVSPNPSHLINSFSLC